uniref:Uncharacterized protein n=1 Tax=Brassica campestris TaxID=3711 RepID=A0A3P6A4X5_BRACM|nr:unnamed protein product [Brassica rapa]
MKAMDPMELLGVLPTCHFGKLCSKKYLSVIHHRSVVRFLDGLVPAG